MKILCAEGFSFMASVGLYAGEYLPSSMGTKYGRKCFLIWRFAAEFKVGFRQSVQAMPGCGKDVACRFVRPGCRRTLALPEDAGRIRRSTIWKPSGLSEESRCGGLSPPHLDSMAVEPTELEGPPPAALRQAGQGTARLRSSRQRPRSRTVRRR